MNHDHIVLMHAAGMNESGDIVLAIAWPRARPRETAV